jgi:hypothetical protein
MGKRTEQSFLKGRSTNGQNIYGKSSVSLVVREIQIKTTLRLHLTLVKMGIIKKINKWW